MSINQWGDGTLHTGSIRRKAHPLPQNAHSKSQHSIGVIEDMSGRFKRGKHFFPSASPLFSLRGVVRWYVTTQWFHLTTQWSQLTTFSLFLTTFLFFQPPFNVPQSISYHPNCGRTLFPSESPSFSLRKFSTSYISSPANHQLTTKARNSLPQLRYSHKIHSHLSSSCPHPTFTPLTLFVAPPQTASCHLSRYVSGAVAFLQE